MAVIIDRSLFCFTWRVRVVLATCHRRVHPRKQSDPQHTTDEDTRAKFDAQAMCFDCCRVLVVGVSLSSDMFRCCHGRSVHVSTCLIPPAQHRFGQTPRELDCTTSHMLNTISNSCVSIGQLLSIVQVFLTPVDVFSRRRRRSR